MSNKGLVLSNSKLPARLANRTALAASPFSGMLSSGGFPVISIKGKVFHTVNGEERKLIMKPGTDDEPASSLEVVVLDFNPHKSKVYYLDGYTEGDTSKPTCYSNDGLTPAADAEDKQHKQCAICPHNQWGSRITDNKKKAKACSDSVRLAVAPAGDLTNAMLLRVPATSIPMFGVYGTGLHEHGVLPSDVVTKVGFDYSVSHPSLTFTLLRFVTDEEADAIEAAKQEPVVGDITGVTTGASAPKAEEKDLTKSETPPASKKAAADADDEDAKAKAKAKAAKKAKAKKAADAAAKAAEAAAKAAAEAEDDDGEEEEGEAPSAKAPVTLAEGDDIDAALDDLDFDD